MFLHRRIATNDFLFKIGLKQADSCSFCGEFTETLAHLFWYCSYTQKFWKDIYQWITQNTTLNGPCTVRPTLKLTSVLSFFVVSTTNQCKKELDIT